MEITKELLNKPAFGPGSVKADGTSETVPAEESQPIKEEEEVKEPVTPSQDDGASEQKVPYSRFNTIRQQARDSEREAEEYRIRYEELLNQRSPVREEEHAPYESAIRDRIIRLYGDNDTSKEIINIELQRQKEIEERAEQRAIEAVRNERSMETRIVNDNLSVIEDNVASLSEYIGRDLTEEEESALLDIVDEYTPKDRDGNYAGDVLSFDKAWDILELKQAQAGASTKRARSNPTNLTNSRTEGEPGSKQEQDKIWNPLDWSSFNKKVKGI